MKIEFYQIFSHLWSSLKVAFNSIEQYIRNFFYFRGTSDIIWFSIYVLSDFFNHEFKSGWTKAKVLKRDFFFLNQKV